MNRKQLVTVWAGTALIILLFFFRLVFLYTDWEPFGDSGYIIVLLMGEDVWLVIALVTFALISTFADKGKGPKGE